VAKEVGRRKYKSLSRVFSLDLFHRRVYNMGIWGINWGTDITSGIYERGNIVQRGE